MNGGWPYFVSVGPTAVDSENHYALQVVHKAVNGAAAVAVYNLNRLAMREREALAGKSGSTRTGAVLISRLQARYVMEGDR